MKHKKVFMLCIKRHFGQYHYIRALESHSNGIHYHVHLIIMFANKLPNNFNYSWVQKHWKHGFFDFKQVTEPYGIIDYITQPKKENINPDNPRFTKLPQFVQIISTSSNFPIANKQEIITTKQGASNFIEQINQSYAQQYGQNLYCYSDKHQYINKTGKLVTCTDNRYFHN